MEPFLGELASLPGVKFPVRQFGQQGQTRFGIESPGQPAAFRPPARAQFALVPPGLFGMVSHLPKVAAVWRIERLPRVCGFRRRFAPSARRQWRLRVLAHRSSQAPQPVRQAVHGDAYRSIYEAVDRSRPHPTRQPARTVRAASDPTAPYLLPAVFS